MPSWLLYGRSERARGEEGGGGRRRKDKEKNAYRSHQRSRINRAPTFENKSRTNGRDAKTRQETTKEQKENRRSKKKHRRSKDVVGYICIRMHAYTQHTHLYTHTHTHTYIYIYIYIYIICTCINIHIDKYICQKTCHVHVCTHARAHVHARTCAAPGKTHGKEKKGACARGGQRQAI